MNCRRLIGMIAGVVMLSGLLFVTPASASTRVYVQIGPPAPIVQPVPVAPAPGYVWIPGFYRWNGHRYIWAPGYYVRPPRVHAVWVPGHWAQARQGWYWVGGRWR